MAEYIMHIMIKSHDMIFNSDRYYFISITIVYYYYDSIVDMNILYVYTSSTSSRQYTLSTLRTNCLYYDIC